MACCVQPDPTPGTRDAEEFIQVSMRAHHACDHQSLALASMPLHHSWVVLVVSGTLMTFDPTTMPVQVVPGMLQTVCNVGNNSFCFLLKMACLFVCHIPHRQLKRAVLHVSLPSEELPLLFSLTAAIWPQVQRVPVSELRRLLIAGDMMLPSIVTAQVRCVLEHGSGTGSAGEVVRQRDCV